MGAPNLPNDERRPEPRKAKPNAEVALGGADAVPTTSYVTGEGTEPERRKTAREPAARVSAGGMGIAGWIAIAVVVAIALFFGASLFR